VGLLGCAGVGVAVEGRRNRGWKGARRAGGMRGNHGRAVAVAVGGGSAGVGEEGGVGDSFSNATN
jgi:hypothetical protein